MKHYDNTCWWLSVDISPVSWYLTLDRIACLPPLCNVWCFKALRTEGSLLHWEGCVWANPHGPSLHFTPSLPASPPYTSIKWRMLTERWIDRCRGPFNYACQKLIPSGCCPSSLICLPNLLVQPKERAPVLFKYVGLVRSFQVFPPESETSNRDNCVNRLTNAQIMMRWAILCLLSVIIHPGDDTVHRESVWCFSTFWIAYRREIHNSSKIILITFSKCAQIKVGASAVTQQRLLLKFKIHTDTRQADEACLISYPFGPKAASLWGMPVLRKPCHLSKAISGWRVRATYDCYTVNIKDALQTHSLLSCKS